MQLFFADIASGRFALEESEVGHCVRVLRKGVGDELELIDGRGNFYRGRIDLATKKVVEGTIEAHVAHFGRVPYALTLAVAPTKNMDRLEWLVEKAVEFGVDRIVPLLCQRSERKVLKTDRLEKIARSATKQSLKGRLVEIDPLTTFADFLKDFEGPLAIAHCEASERVAFSSYVAAASGPLCVMIGPEGDFSPEEIALAVEKGATPIHLGSSRLRTETAALAAVTMVYSAFLES